MLLFSLAEISCYKDIVMYFSYISPEGSTIYTGYDQQNGIIRMKENVENLKLFYPDTMLFLSGDFNARIKDRIDFIPEDNLSYIFVLVTMV